MDNLVAKRESESTMSSFLNWMSLVTALSASAAEPECVPQAQVDVATIDRQVVLIGEVHGTNEIPRFTAGLVCSLVRAHRSVVLGVEHTGEQQEAINRYLTSAGTPADRADLLDGINWRSYTDGRGSVAMFELIDEVRRLRRQGARVGVLAIDRNENLDVPLRDDEKVPVSRAANVLLNRLGNRAMADNVLSAATLYPNYTLVVLTGYSHASTVAYGSNNPLVMSYEPMGMLIARQMPVFTIGIDTGGGEAAQNGRRIPLTAGSLYEPAVRVDAKVSIDRLSPSMPARDVGR